MNCIYCQQECEEHKDREPIYLCHPCEVRFIMDENNHIDIITFWLDKQNGEYQYCLDLDYVSKATLLLKHNVISDNPNPCKLICIHSQHDDLLILQHIIPITPATKAHWLDKLLSLMIFS